MTTAQGIITQALKKIGVLTKSSVPDADESADGLVSLNNLLSSWSNESLLIYARTWEAFSITGAASYTIGTGQTLNTVRPISIISAYVTQGTTDYQLSIIPDEVYAQIPVKTTTGIPENLNYDNGFAAGKIRLYPVANTTYTLNLLSEKQLSTFALTDTVSLPPGWERALVYNLAVEMSPEYGVDLDALTLAIARESKGMISLAVSKNRQMTSLVSSKDRYSIYTDI